MRTVAEIDEDISVTESKLRRLHDERRGAVRRRSEVIVADFDGGLNTVQISELRKLGYSVVQGILYRAGRTEKGRVAVQRQLATVG